VQFKGGFTLSFGPSDQLKMSLATHKLMYYFKVLKELVSEMNSVFEWGGRDDGNK